MKSGFFNPAVAAQVASDALLTDEEFLRYRAGAANRRYMGFSNQEKLVEVIASESISNLVEMAYQTGQAIQRMSLLGVKEHNGVSEDEWFLQRSLIASRAEQLTESNATP